MTPTEETAALVAEARQYAKDISPMGSPLLQNLADALERKSQELAEARRDSERLRKGLEDITTANDMGQIAVDGGDWEHCSTWARHILHQHHAARQNGGRA